MDVREGEEVADDFSYLSEPVDGVDYTEIDVRPAYEAADSALTKVKVIDQQFVQPACNQLRYVGDHLSRYFNSKDPKTLVQAINHARRATYDAYEAGVLFRLVEFKIFEDDFKDVPILERFPRYAEYQTHKIRIRDEIIEASDRNKHLDDFMNSCSRHFDELTGICDQLKAVRPELNKVKQEIEDRKLREHEISLVQKRGEWEQRDRDRTQELMLAKQATTAVYGLAGVLIMAITLIVILVK